MNENDLKFFTECPYSAQAKIRALEHLGVKFIDKNSAYIGLDVQVGKGTVLWPNCYLLGSTTIGENCEIEPGVILEDVEVDDGSTIHAGAYIRGGCRIDKDVEVWPGVSMYNSWLRDGVVAHSSSRIVRSVIGKNADLDSHCLIKDTNVGGGSKVAAHAVIIGKRRPHRKFRRD